MIDNIALFEGWTSRQHYVLIPTWDADGDFIGISCADGGETDLHRGDSTIRLKDGRLWGDRRDYDQFTGLLTEAQMRFVHDFVTTGKVDHNYGATGNPDGNKQETTLPGGSWE